PIDRDIQFRSDDNIRAVSKTTSELTVRNLHFSYEKGQDVIRGLNVTLSGEPIAIIGQNGAGKTTFVKLLKALLKPDSGEILLDGTPISKTTAAKLASRIGLIFQNPNDQIFKHKVIDEVMFGPLNIGQSNEEASANAK